MGAIKSEWWAASNRNDGRDHLGIRSLAGLLALAALAAVIGLALMVVLQPR